MTVPTTPLLPDGIVVVVKRECETCQMVVPVLRELSAGVELHVYTQDDPNFPGDPAAIPDSDLAVSWFHDIETVPTVIRVVDGVEVGRTAGWMRSAWEELTGVEGLGADLPPMRPGCGSMSVDPDLVDKLRVRFGGSTLSSRRIEVAAAEDEFEMMFARGWTDGLPVVPPTEERVMAMLEATTRAPGDIVATIPPNLDEINVEKIAIAAVMAGCKPEYLPWVLTAVEAACNDEFNMHGLLATTMPVSPVIVAGYRAARARGAASSRSATWTEAAISSARIRNSAAGASPTVPAIIVLRRRRSGMAVKMAETRAQLRGVQAMVRPRRRLSSVVSNRSGRVRIKAMTAGCSPRGTA